MTRKAQTKDNNRSKYPIPAVTVEEVKNAVTNMERDLNARNTSIKNFEVVRFWNMDVLDSILKGNQAISVTNYRKLVIEARKILGADYVPSTK